MKHTLRLTLGLLALGFATSVLVAWACFAAWQVDFVSPSRRPATPTYALVDSADGVRAWYLASGFGAIAGLTVANVSWPESGMTRHWTLRGYLKQIQLPPTNPDDKYLFRLGDSAYQFEAFGWPSPSMARRTRVFRPPAGRPFLAKVPMDAHSALVPSTLIGRGLFLNTLFYAAIWTIPLVFIPSLIRWRRARKGGCPTCGYDITGLSTCPECGTALAESAPA